MVNKAKALEGCPVDILTKVSEPKGSIGWEVLADRLGVWRFRYNQESQILLFEEITSEGDWKISEIQERVSPGETRAAILAIECDLDWAEVAARYKVQKAPPSIACFITVHEPELSEWGNLDELDRYFREKVNYAGFPRFAPQGVPFDEATKIEIGVVELPCVPREGDFIHLSDFFPFGFFDNQTSFKVCQVILYPGGKMQEDCGYSIQVTGIFDTLLETC